MIIVRGKLVAREEAQFVVGENVNGFSILDMGNQEIFEFDKTLLEFAPDIAYLARSIWQKPVLFWQSEIGHTRDAYSAICLRKKIHMNGLQAAYAMFAVDTNDAAHMIVYGDTFVETPDSQVEVISPDTIGTGCDIFEARLPSIKAFMDHSRAKVAALARFNAVDAIAGLENQVDLLTAAVKALVAGMPAEQRPAWWDSFEAAVLPNASYNLIGVDKAIGNVDAEKVKARQTQADYFARLTNG